MTYLSAMSDRFPTGSVRRCPICGRPAEPTHRPFCSERCRLVDLGRWLKGDYRIPAEEPPDTEPDEERDA